jgi:hypothetical protein
MGLTIGPDLFAPQHNWAPYWLRIVVGVSIISMGFLLTPMYHLYTRRNVFRASLSTDKTTMEVTTLSPWTFRPQTKSIPLSLIHPEPKQGKWLRMSIKDGKGSSLPMYFERTGQFKHYRLLESIVKGEYSPSSTPPVSQ